MWHLNYLTYYYLKKEINQTVTFKVCLVWIVTASHVLLQNKEIAISLIIIMISWFLLQLVLTLWKWENCHTLQKSIHMQAKSFWGGGREAAWLPIRNYCLVSFSDFLLGKRIFFSNEWYEKTVDCKGWWTFII